MLEHQYSCANPACRISETGKCVEGLIPDDCPHLGAEALSESELNIESEEDLESSVAEGFALPNGAALDVAGAAELLTKGESRVIAVVGPRETGKTSLVAGIYDLFQTGPIGEISFARSKTLTAFEIACHDARASSRRDIPHMERTRLGEVLFYHLELAGGSALTGTTLLLGDRSGEEYSDVADDISNAKDLVEVQRADVITILIDGARLLDAGRRHNIRMEVKMIIQGLIDGGSLRSHQRIALVLTKLDLIEASQNRARAEGDFQSLYDHLSMTFLNKVREFVAFKIAAAPATAGLARGTGIASLLRFWLADMTPVGTDKTPVVVGARAFARIVPLD